MIPVCEPLLEGNELRYVKDCLKSNWISSQGKYIRLFEDKFAAFCNRKYAVSVTSGTTALHLALAALGIGKGDEVIVPTFTMIAPVFAIVYTGARPVLVDADLETWCMDAAKVEEKITPRTRAIMAVHIYGHPCDMSPLISLAKRRNLYLIEDAAEAHGAEYKGRRCGSLSDAACFSFYANKIITTGEGGMVVTDNNKIAERARELKDLGFLKERRYLHRTVGFNYRMTNIQAAIGLAQLERIKDLAEKRRRNAALYNRYLRGLEGVVLPAQRPWAKNCYWMYSLLAEKVDRERLRLLLKRQGIDTRAFFIPMHRQPVFLKLGLFRKERYPVSEYISARGLYLPSSPSLSERQIRYIAGALKKSIARLSG